MPVLKASLLCLLVLPTLAIGAESLATLGDLAKLQSDTILYEAETARAQAKLTMQDVLRKAGDDQQMRGSGEPPVQESELPTVTGISGAAGWLYATFLYPNGTTASAKSGSQIPGGFVVAEVGIDRVVLTRGDRRIPLQFGVANAPPPAPAHAQITQTPMTLPMPTPLPGQSVNGAPLR